MVVLAAGRSWPCCQATFELLLLMPKQTIPLWTMTFWQQEEKAYEEAEAEQWLFLQWFSALFCFAVVIFSSKSYFYTRKLT